MINFGPVPAGSVLPVYFSTYGKTNGESITLTGLAVTDIEIYKGTSITQRASDAGYALIDTDGIDVDGVTGIHAFSIDTGDNTDAGFYAAGSFYTVVVSAVTIDSQTVNFIAATFRIVAAENTAGTPVADTVRVAGTAQTAGDLKASLNTIDDFIDTEVAAIITTLGTPAGASVSADIAAVKFDSAAILADTGTDGVVVNAAGLATDAVNEIADGILNRDMSTGTDSGSTTVRTMRQALRFLRNKWSISGTTLTVCKEDDSTASWTSTVTATAGTDPITANDPAGP